MKPRVIAVVDDMFFAAKIRGTGEQAGVRVDFARSAESLIAEGTEEPPASIIVDLHSERTDPFEMAERLKRDERLRAVPLIGFYSHVRTDIPRRATAAGFDYALPRSLFTKNLIDILNGRFT